MENKSNNKILAEIIGGNIRRYRYEARLTIQKLAEYAMIDEKNLGRIELGQRTASTEVLIKLSDVLDVTSLQ